MTTRGRPSQAVARRAGAKISRYVYRWAFTTRVPWCLACQLTFFTAMGTLIILTVAYSLGYSLLFFMPLLRVAGPEGRVGDICHFLPEGPQVRVLPARVDSQFCRRLASYLSPRTPSCNISRARDRSPVPGSRPSLTLQRARRRFVPRGPWTSAPAVITKVRRRHARRRCCDAFPAPGQPCDSSNTKGGSPTKRAAAPAIDVLDDDVLDNCLGFLDAEDELLRGPIRAVASGWRAIAARCAKRSVTTVCARLAKLPGARRRAPREGRRQALGKLGRPPRDAPAAQRGGSFMVRR